MILEWMIINEEIIKNKGEPNGWRKSDKRRNEKWMKIKWKMNVD